MTMHLYVLTREGEKVVEQYSPCWGASKLKVRGRDWYAARGDCIRHAIEHGHSAICIAVGSVELYHRPHGSTPRRMTREQQHGLWMYLNRLAVRYGHVYVPPLAWAKQKHHEYFLNPTIPMVAAYQVRAVQSLDNFDAPFGKQLCSNGYDSFTLGDYFYFNHGQPVLDEPGTATTWRAAYERAIARLV